MTVTFVEEYRTIDKAEWGEGEWTSEPDKAVWVDEATGLDCMIVRNRMGGLCGYVGVPEGHSCFGKAYQEQPTLYVHGGLTFSDRCHPHEDESKGICHIPQTGRTDTVWWLGFDCGHMGDSQPGLVARERMYYAEAEAKGDKEGMRVWSTTQEYGTYKGVRYVIFECQRLAAQLADIT